MKFLTTGAYYTSEPGVAELGYVGNEPLEGDYPGPTRRRSPISTRSSPR